jgi:hypothetical protein
MTIYLVWKTWDLQKQDVTILSVAITAHEMCVGGEGKGHELALYLLQQMDVLY